MRVVVGCALADRQGCRPASRLFPGVAGEECGTPLAGNYGEAPIADAALAHPTGTASGRGREPPDRAANVDEVRIAGVSRAGGSRAKLRERRPLLRGVTAASGSRRRSASGRRRGSIRGGNRMLEFLRGMLRPRLLHGAASPWGRPARITGGVSRCGRICRTPACQLFDAKSVQYLRNASQVSVRFKHLPPEFVAFGFCESIPDRPPLGL